MMSSLKFSAGIDLVDEGGVLELSCMKMKTRANAAVRWLTVLSGMSECFAGISASSGKVSAVPIQKAGKTIAN